MASAGAVLQHIGEPNRLVGEMFLVMTNYGQRRSARFSIFAALYSSNTKCTFVHIFTQLRTPPLLFHQICWKGAGPAYSSPAEGDCVPLQHFVLISVIFTLFSALYLRVAESVCSILRRQGKLTAMRIRSVGREKA